MKKQVLVIGLGQFGMSIAKALSDKNFEVIATDVNKELVDEAANFVTDAVCLNSIDEISLRKLSPKDRDFVICSIGAKEPSILTTALLVQMGCENVIARAADIVHARILKAVGAKCVINPEEEYGKKFADKLLFQDIFSFSPDDEIELIELKVPPFMLGKTLIELALPSAYGIIVAAIKQNGVLLHPLPDRKFEKDDVLLLVSSSTAIEKMLKDNN